MKKLISADEIFITYDKRSSIRYQKALATHIEAKFGQIATSNPKILKPILEECYDWSTTQFTNAVRAINDKFFVNYLFAFHESSVKLWIRVLGGEKIVNTIRVTEDELAMNRRVFKLALEQTCDVSYTHCSKFTPEIAKHYDEVIVDLLFLGSEIIGFAQYLAEMRMIQGTLLIDINAEGILRLTRPPEIEAIFSKLIDMMKEDFQYGIFDKNGVNDMKDALKKIYGY